MSRSTIRLAALLPLLCPLFLAAAEKGEGRRDLPRERAEWNAAFRLDAAGVIDGRHRLEALRHACRLPVDPSMAPVESRSDTGTPISALATFPGTSWQPLGPRPIRSNSSWGDVAGRVTALAIDPANPAIVFAGAATGGIWKSTDSGTTWRAVSDTAPALAISAITFSPSNPNVLYAATGEADSADLEFRPSRSLGTYLGAGILRSADLGETWSRIDTNLPPNSVVSRVLVHPTNPQLVLAGLYIAQNLASDNSSVGGVWRSTDGGVTFVKTFSHAVSDLAQDPNRPDAVWAAFGITGGCASCTSPSGVYLSMDFGSTFTPSLVPSTPGVTFTSPTGNIKIGVASTNPTTVYASVLDLNDSHQGGGIYRTTDGGATWSARQYDYNMCRSSSATLNAGQCEYDHFIQPVPGAPDTVWFGGIDLFRSTDGGNAWRNVSNVYTSGAPPVHPDQHAGAVPAGAPATLFLGNDGGVYRSTDGGSSFTSLNGSLTLAQFNGVALHPTDPNAATGGTQDNGNIRFTGTLDWSDRTGGDGGFNLIRADNPNVRLAGIYYSTIMYSSDGGDSYTDVSPSFGNDDIGFYPPAAAAPAAPGTVFVGTTRVWASTSFGSDGIWTARSATPIVSDTDVITALEVVGDGSGPIWAATRSRSGPPTYGVYFSSDGGKTFGPRGASLPNAIVSQIRAVSADGKSAYAVFGGFSGLPSKHVYRTTDGGQSWTNLSGDLPDVPVSSIAVDPGDPGDLFIGTDVGVFRSRDGGASWLSFNQGLPNATVSALQFHAATGDLWAATYGRGAYRIPAAGGGALPPAADFTFSPPLPAPGQSVAFHDASSGSPDTWSWDFGDGGTSTQRNPWHVYQQAGSYVVRFGASNVAGSSIASKTVNVTTGASSPVTLQVPVVLDVYGVAPTHFTSDLVAVNRSGAPTRLTVQYLPEPGTPGAGGPRVGLSLDAGREWRIPDVLAWLRANGYALPPSGTSEVGTLRITFEDVSDPTLVFAGSRTSTPNPNAARGGSFGLFSAASPTSGASSSGGTIWALREDSGFRSNVAIVDVPSGSGPAMLSLQPVNGDTGQPAGPAIPYTLQPGEWHQFGRILSGTGATNGYVNVRRVGGGSDPFLAYGVVNEAHTGDGSFVGTDGAAGLVPIVLSVNSAGVLYTSELVLANTGAATVSATVAYTPAASLGGSGGPYTASVALGPGRQLRIPDAIAWLRDTLHLPLPASGNQGGTLLVTGAVAYVRTSNPNPDTTVGGSFGLAYPAVAAASRAKTEAWVYGLVQDAATRSNLAVADARVGDPSSVTYVVEVWDSDSGSADPVWSTTVALAGGEWWQASQILSSAGVTHGYARVRPQSGTSDYVAYGILNDGAQPGLATSDGSYVPMSGVR